MSLKRAQPRRIGVHPSIAGGVHLALERAKALGCTTMQIFSHNPRQWQVTALPDDAVAKFRELKAAYDIAPVFVHTSYLINLAARDASVLRRSIALMIDELNLADRIGAEYLVLHTGSASQDDPDQARQRAADALGEIAAAGTWTTGLLLENTAGERGDITSRIADMAGLIALCPTGFIAGICLDTCHAFAAGYDLNDPKAVDALAQEIGKGMGPDRLKLIHLNDSKKGLGSHVDRHEHLGDGPVGIKGLKLFLNHPAFADIPLVLETPKNTEEDDPRNLKIARSLLHRS
jgi:deoxyribonuclease-4